MSREKHFSLQGNAEIFSDIQPLDHTADTSLLAAARPFWPVAERPHNPRSDGPAILLPRWGFMFLMTTPFGSLKLTS